MRVKSHWFKAGRNRTPSEIAGVLAYIVWQIGDKALKNTRKAEFEIAVGAQYFSFLSEFLVFLIQVADRIAYRELSAEDRLTFTSTLANRIAETLAENQSRLVGDSPAEHKQHFIDKLNLRAGEYADFDYGGEGPSFAFTRYLAFCMGDIMDEKDRGWITDHLMATEAPQAVDTIGKAMRDLFVSPLTD